jgi:hypothetical protein
MIMAECYRSDSPLYCGSDICGRLLPAGIVIFDEVSRKFFCNSSSLEEVGCIGMHETRKNALTRSRPINLSYSSHAFLDIQPDAAL